MDEIIEEFRRKFLDLDPEGREIVIGMLLLSDQSETDAAVSSQLSGSDRLDYGNLSETERRKVCERFVHNIENYVKSDGSIVN